MKYWKIVYEEDFSWLNRLTIQIDNYPDCSGPSMITRVKGRVAGSIKASNTREALDIFWRLYDELCSTPGAKEVAEIG